MDPDRIVPLIPYILSKISTPRDVLGPQAGSMDVTPSTNPEAPRFPGNTFVEESEGLCLEFPSTGYGREIQEQDKLLLKYRVDDTQPHPDSNALDIGNHPAPPPIEQVPGVFCEGSGSLCASPPLPSVRQPY